VKAVRRAIDQHVDHRLLLIVGFDGVLVDYESDPESVALSRRVRGVLTALRDRGDTTLGIISGRRASDLRARADLGAQVFYVGLHGLEVAGPGFATAPTEMVDRYGRRIREIAGAFANSSVPPGIHVEDKQAAVAVHTREAAPSDTVWARLHVLNAAADLVNADALRVYRGNHVLELLPNVRAPRTTAVTAVRRYLERRDGTPVFTVYVAEDVRDDDAFGGLAEPSASVAVGWRAPRAEFHVDSTRDVRTLLAGLAARAPGVGMG
jgi:trehalose-phosphatase